MPEIPLPVPVPPVDGVVGVPVDGVVGVPVVGVVGVPVVGVVGVPVVGVVGVPVVDVAGTGTTPEPQPANATLAAIATQTLIPRRDPLKRISLLC